MRRRRNDAKWGTVENYRNRGNNMLKRQTALLLVTIAAGILVASGIAWAKNVTCQVGASACKGTKKADFILGSSGVDNIKGLKGNDLLKGEGASDVILGSSGNDRIQDDINGTTAANGGNDQLSAGSGSDVLAGMAGNDTYTDGPTTKVLTDRNILMDFGALGVGTNDRYVFKKPFGIDVVSDMRGTDVIDLTAYSSSEIAQAFVVDTDLSPNGKWDALLFHFRDGSRLGIVGFFDDTSSNAASPGGPGYGRIETVSFADGNLALGLASSDLAPAPKALRTALQEAAQQVDTTDLSSKDGSESEGSANGAKEPTLSLVGGQAPGTNTLTPAETTNLSTGRFTFSFGSTGPGCIYNWNVDWGDGKTTSFTVGSGSTKHVTHWYAPGDYVMNASASGTPTDTNITCNPGSFSFQIHVGADSFALDITPPTVADPGAAMGDMLFTVGGQSDTNATSVEG